MIMTTSAYRGIQVPSLRNLQVRSTEIEIDGPYEIKQVERGAGVRCGNHHRQDRVFHANTASVRACYELAKQLQAEQEAEIAVELAYERHLEDRGYWEARADEDREFWSGVSHYDPQGW